MCKKIQQNLEEPRMHIKQINNFKSCVFGRVLVVSWTNKLGRKIGCVLSIVRSEREWVNWRFDLIIL